MGKKTALVIGGSGPTGPHIVQGLQERGFQVSTLGRGVHTYDHGPDVGFIRADPHFVEPLSEALSGQSFDVVIATYGRLKAVSEALVGKAGQIVAAGGFALYRGWHHPSANFPAGMPLPAREDAPIETNPEESRFASLIAGAERALLERHADATVYRYPYVYGPRQVSPREWGIVRRVLDGRHTMLLLNGGRPLITHAYSVNLAHALLLAVDRPEVAAGKAYNCGDSQQFDQRQIVEIAGEALGVSLDFISLPDSVKGQALATMRTNDHQLVDTRKLESELGYRDLVPPAEAMMETFRWYRDNPLERGGDIESNMLDAFDYAAEDEAIARAREYEAAIEAIETPILEFSHPYAHPKASTLGRDEKGR